MSDNRPVVVTIDANAAIDSNRYADPIKTNGRWVEQIKPGSGSFNGRETMSYEYRGATANGLMVFLAAWSGGGSGTFTYLHVVDAVVADQASLDDVDLGFGDRGTGPDELARDGPGSSLRGRRPGEESGGLAMSSWW